MKWSRLFRIALFTAIGLAFCGSLLGILLTGPIVVVRQPLDLGIDVSPERLRATVEKLCTEFTPRSYRHVENLDRAAAWIAEELRAAGLAVEIQEYELDEGRFRNVIARRPSSDPSKGVVIIGAHYDAYGDFAGADDNASGVAVLLELARTLPDQLPRQGHWFAAFSTEEPPYFRSEEMGSYKLAEKLVSEGTPVDLMVALDVVGYYTDEPGSQHFPIKGLNLLYPSRGNFVAVVGDLRSGRWLERVKQGMRAVETLPVYSFRSPVAWAPVDLSDHWAFRELGLPGVQVTDTAFMRFPFYHMAEDTPEKLDYERMAQLVQALHGVLWERTVDDDS